MNAAEVIAALGGKSGMCRCPAHVDTTPSLSVTDGDKGVVAHCHAGCSQDAVLDALKDRGVDLRKPNGHDRVPFSVATFAQAKQLKFADLKGHGVLDVALDGGQAAIAFEYRARDGTLTGTKYRRGMTGERGFFWRKGSRTSLYGLWRTADMHELDGRLLIVEGESDTLTLWQHEFSALGLPGAAMWREEWLKELPENGTVYVVIEPDQGGESVKAWLAKSELRHRAKLITMRDHKDVSALHLADPENFAAAFEKLIAAAVPATSAEEPEEPRVHLRSAADIVSNPIPAAWLLRPYLEEFVLALLFGEFGTLKSFVTLDMLLSIAAGQGWAGSRFKPAPRPTVYVSAEGKGLAKRLQAWSMHHGVSLDTLPFYAVEHSLDLSNDVGIADLVAAIDALKIQPAVIGIDTLSRNAGPLDENSTGDMAGLLNALDTHLRQRLKCSVLLVHHTGHSAKERSRGSYALLSNTDANYRCERPDPEQLTIKMTTGRLKDSESPPAIYLKAVVVDLGKTDEDGQRETSLVLLPTDERPTEAKKRPSGRRQIDVLKLLEAEHREGTTVWTIGEIRKLARQRLQLHKTTAQSCVRALAENGFLTASVGGMVLADPPSANPGASQ